MIYTPSLIICSSSLPEEVLLCILTEFRLSFSCKSWFPDRPGVRSWSLNSTSFPGEDASSLKASGSATRLWCTSSCRSLLEPTHWLPGVFFSVDAATFLEFSVSVSTNSSKKFSFICFPADLATTLEPWLPRDTLPSLGVESSLLAAAVWERALEARLGLGGNFGTGELLAGGTGARMLLWLVGVAILRVGLLWGLEGSRVSGDMIGNASILDTMARLFTGSSLSPIGLSSRKVWSPEGSVLPPTPISLFSVNSRSLGRTSSVCLTWFSSCLLSCPCSSLPKCWTLK